MIDYVFNPIVLPMALRGHATEKIIMITVCLMLSLLTASADPPSDPNKKELEQLAGEWVMQQVEVKGQKVELKDSDPKMVLEIKDSKWIFTGKEKGEIIALDVNANPKCMDMRSSEEGRKGQVDEAIYKIEGNTLTICLHQGKGKRRPGKFETSPDDPDTILVVFQRAKQE